MPSVLFLLAAVLLATDATVVNRLYSGSGLQNKAFTQKVVFTSPAKSALHCAFLCNQHESCETFTFEQDFCRGHALEVTSATSYVIAAGAQLFSVSNNKLGLDALYLLTSGQQHKLRVDLMMWDNTTGSATYSNFSISDSSDNYRLHFDSFIGGNAGDSLDFQRAFQFSTWDRDHDTWGGNCAQQYHGAWWYGACHRSSLNGEYKPNSTAQPTHGIHWYYFGGESYSHKYNEMKIRVV